MDASNHSSQMLHMDADLSLISTITGLRDAKRARIEKLEFEIASLKEDLTHIDIALKAIGQAGVVDPTTTATSSASVSSEDSDLVPLDIEAVGLPLPSKNAEAGKLVDFILEAERLLAPTRAHRGLSPKEISLEINRIFGRDLDMHKINGRVWYLFKKNKMSKRDKFYFLPSKGEAAEATSASTASDITPAETGGR